MNYELFAVDIIAIVLLAFAVYFPRHRRKDLAVALIGVNIGVLAVTTALASSTSVSAGLGLGLFGVLSIIRLRSTELSQVEVAYYFASLAIGLLGGMGSGMSLLHAVALIGAIVLGLGIADSPYVMRTSRNMQMVVDRAIPTGEELANYIERTTGLHVREANIVRIDYVNDSTLVDLRCVEPKRVTGRAPRRSVAS